MMKQTIKLLVAGICISMLCTLSAAAADLEEKGLLLEYLGIITDNTELDSVATRADMARMFAKAMTESDIESIVDKSFKTADVFEYSEEYAYIAYLYQKGLLDGHSDGNFYPGEPAELEHAAKLATKLIGAVRGANDASYTAVLLRTGINIHVSGAYMTKGELAELIYEMLMHDMYYIEYSSDESYYVDYSGSGLKYLERVFGIYELEGIISADDKTSLFAKESLAEGRYRINNDVYENETGRTDLFGMNIKGFYKKDEDKGQTLIVAYPYRTNILSIAADKIEDYEGNRYEYTIAEYDESYKKARLKNGFTVIYNGEFVGGSDGFNYTYMTPESGSIMLIDNDNDNNYDVVIIKDYKNAVFNMVDEELKRIYTKSGNFDYNDEELKVYDAEGNKISIGSVAADSIVSIAESFDKQKTNVIVSSKTISGTVKSKTGDYIMIDDGLFYYISDLSEKLEVGAAGKFYLNFENKIVYSDISYLDGWLYGYLLNVIDDQDTETVNFKLFTQDGRTVCYKAAKKFTIDGDWLEYTYSQALERVSDDTGNYKGLVRIQIDNNANIKQIDTIKHGIKETENSLSQFKGVQKTLGYRKGSNTFGCYFVVDDNTKFFIVPNNAGEEDLSVLPKSMLISSTGYPVLGAYKSKADSFVADAVILNADSYVLSTAREQHLCVVEDITKVINKEDEVVYRLTLSNDKNKRFTVETKSLDTLYIPSVNKTVSKGDAIRYGYNVDGIIDNGNIMLVYDMDTDWHLESIDSTSIDNYMSVKVGYIYDIDGSYAQIQFVDPSEPGGEAADKYFLSLSRAVVYTVDRKTGEVTSCSSNDLKSWKKNKEVYKVAYHAEYGEIFCIYMYE